jgi:hypothetical protein
LALFLANAVPARQQAIALHFHAFARRRNPAILVGKAVERAKKRRQSRQNVCGGAQRLAHRVTVSRTTDEQRDSNCWMPWNKKPVKTQITA